MRRPDDTPGVAVRAVFRRTRYRPVQRLGAGAAGEVWQVWDADARTFVAAKVLRPGANPTESRLRWFQEQELRVEHPNVISGREWHHGPDGSFMVMDLATGPDLDRFLADNDTLPEGVVLAVAADLFAALDHLHSRGLIHRDLKPGNVLFDRTGPTPVVRVIDLGSALDISGPRLTIVPGPVGTVGYLAPEVVAGEEADERSDLWSAGRILTELFSRVPEPSPELDEVCGRLTAAEPRNRPSSAARVLVSVRELMARHPRPFEESSATRFSTRAPVAEPRDLRKLARRGLAAGLVLALIVAAAMLVTDYLGYRDFQARVGPAKDPTATLGTIALKATPETAARLDVSALAATGPVDVVQCELDLVGGFRPERACDRTTLQATEVTGGSAPVWAVETIQTDGGRTECRTATSRCVLLVGVPGGRSGVARIVGTG